MRMLKLTPLPPLSLPSFVPLQIKFSFPPHPFSLPSFCTKWGNVCQHMSPSANKHFQYVENNILALGLFHQDVMNAVHLSQPPALFLAEKRLSQPNNHYIKDGEVEDFRWKQWVLFSIITSQYKSSTVNPLHPPFCLAFSHLPKITQVI